MNKIIAYAELPLSVDLSGIQTEINNLPTQWNAHFNTVYYNGEWTVLPLRSPGGKPDVTIPDTMNDEVYGYTAWMDLCPCIKDLISTLKCDVMSVRLLNLKKGSVIKTHNDPDLAFEKGEARLHVPVFTNEHVEFYLQDERVVMKAGECWYINANLKHSVFNGGESDRIHLVIDCKVNEWLASMFEKSAQVYANDNGDIETTRKIIAELLLQNTTAARKLADELICTLNKA